MQLICLPEQTQNTDGKSAKHGMTAYVSEQYIKNFDKLTEFEKAQQFNIQLVIKHVMSDLSTCEPHIIYHLSHHVYSS